MAFLASDVSLRINKEKSRSLRILHLYGRVAPEAGGLPPIVLGLTQKQLELGHEAAIWCVENPLVAKEVAGTFGLPAERIVPYTTIGPKRLAFSRPMRQAIASGLGEYFDVVHQHSIWSAISSATTLWRAEFKRPTVIAPQGTLEDFTLRRSHWKKWFARFLYEAKNLREASCLQATSPAEVESFRKRGLTNPVAVIPNAVSESWLNSNGNPGVFRKRFSLSNDKKIILYLSRIHPKKGLPLLFNAIEGIKPHLRDWIIVVAGPDEAGHLAELKALVGRLHLSEYVRFVGPLYAEMKRNAFAASELFVLPTHSDNFAIAVAEALGAGIPVITTYGAPWQEIRENNCGWWTPISASGIRDAIQEAVQLPSSELAAMGENGRALVRKKYTWDSVTTKTLELYDWLIAGGSTPSFIDIV